MSEDIRKMIDKVKNFKQFVNGNIKVLGFTGTGASTQPRIILSRNRGTAIGTPVANIAGTQLGTFGWNGTNSVGQESHAAAIVGVVRTQQTSRSSADIRFQLMNNPAGSGSLTTNFSFTAETARFGIGTTAPSYDIGISGDATRQIGLERQSVSNTAGNNLTVSAGGATSGATNKDGGNAIITSGISTGTGISDIISKTPTPSASGTSDNALVNREVIMTRTLADNGTFTLDASRSGMAWITFGDGEEYAWFSFTTGAVVTLIINSANVTTTATTNDKLNIYDGGTAVSIENTFTATKVMTVKVIYNL